MRRWTLVVCLLVAAGLLSGCGARGGLDPPPGSTAPKARRSLRPRQDHLSGYRPATMHHFGYLNGVLHAEGVSIAAIAEEVGTPFYCYSTATLERHYRVFDDAFGERRSPDLLFDEGQFQPGRRQDPCRSRRRHRRRFRRRIAPRPGARRSRPQDRVFRRRQDRPRDGSGAQGAHRLLQRGIGARASSS